MSRKLNQSKNDLGIKAKKDATSVETRDIHKSFCPRRSKKKQDADLVLTIRDANEDQTQGTTNWVLDIGSGRLLVNDLSLLEEVIDCNYECFAAASDGRPLRITNQGSAMIRVKSLGSIMTIRLLDV